ncbi:PID-CTERM protein-sorting domain-containing protein [Snuella sedimenti]|uniref:PID-CTERM protein-sorting domain-containing protein n=1 Tax=Snuella sedimenti TaxID=2798802 RepID=UPI00374449A4
MIIQNKRIFASILFVLISFVCVAQAPPPPAVTPPGTPIDGGILIGICVGLFYGAKKLLKNNF